MNQNKENANSETSTESAADVFELLSRLEKYDHELRLKDAHIYRLSSELARLKRIKFAQTREAFIAVGQGDLFEDTLAADLAEIEARIEAALPPAETASTTSPRKKHPGRKPLPPELPREVHRHEPTSCQCGQCGGTMTMIREDVTETLDIVPAKFFVQRHVYPQYACRACEIVEAVPAVPAIIEGGMASPGVLAWVVISKYVDHCVLRTQPLRFGWKRCFTKDEGRPLEVGLQEQASNHHKLRKSRVSVVSVVGKGGARLRQVRFKETNASESLMTCRKVYKRCQNREGVVDPGQGWGIPDYCPTGIRHEGDVTLNQALVRNVGTCRPVVKGEAQADSLRKGQSTDAGHRDGAVCSRDEGSVMELDRRGGVVQPCCADNLRREDRRG